MSTLTFLMDSAYGVYITIKFWVADMTLSQKSGSKKKNESPYWRSMSTLTFLMVGVFGV